MTHFETRPRLASFAAAGLAPATACAAPERDPRRWWALAALCAVVFAVGLDLTVLNVALPTLARELSASTSDLQWFVNAYTLALAAGLLPAGALTDRMGAKPVLLGAIIAFAAASYACGAAATPATLIAARVLLGLASAALTTGAMAILTIAFDTEERPRAMGTWMTVNGIGMPIGPLLGGWLLDHAHWGWVFWINVPIALGAAGLALAVVPATRPRPEVGIDLLGAALSALGLGLFTYGLIAAGTDGWGARTPWIFMGSGTVALALLVAVERRLARPLLDLTLFRDRTFAWATAALTAATLATMGLLFVLPQYSQSVRGDSAFDSGLRLLPLIGGLIVGAKLGPALGERLGIRREIAIAFGVLALACALGARTTVDSGWAFVYAWSALGGLGFGLSLPSAMALATGSLVPAKAGAGSAMLQAFRQVGGTFGVAILGSLLGSAYRSELAVPAALPAPAAEAARGGIQGALAVARALHLPELADSARAAFATGMAQSLLFTAALAVLTVAFAALVSPAASESGADREAVED